MHACAAREHHVSALAFLHHVFQHSSIRHRSFFHSAFPHCVSALCISALFSLHNVLFHYFRVTFGFFSFFHSFFLSLPTLQKVNLDLNPYSTNNLLFLSRCCGSETFFPFFRSFFPYHA